MNRPIDFYKSDTSVLRFFFESGGNPALTSAMKSRRFLIFKRKVAKAITEQYKYTARKIDTLLPLNKAEIDSNIYEQLALDFMALSMTVFDGDIIEYLTWSSNIGGQAGLTKLNIDAVFNLKSPELVRQLGDAKNLLIKRVDSTTKNDIARIISKEFKAGKTNEEIAKILLSKNQSIMTLNRAEMIAHAELSNAMNTMELKTYYENGVQRYKWVTSGDNRVTEGCRANEAVGWVKIGESFPSGHQAPPRFPRCRCRMEPDRKTILPFNQMWNG